MGPLGNGMVTRIEREWLRMLGERRPSRPWRKWRGLLLGIASMRWRSVCTMPIESATTVGTLKTCVVDCAGLIQGMRKSNDLEAR